MAKRFTDTDIWKSQRWFRKLPPMDKLVFYYIKDQCNHAGVWKIDCSDLMDDLGIESFNLNKFIDSVNKEYDKISGQQIEKERVVVIENNLWITGFIQFQYQNKEGRVSQSAAPVVTALLMLQGLGVLVQAIRKGYILLSQPLNKGLLRAKDKDIDKDKDKEEKNKETTDLYFEESSPPTRDIPEGYNTFPTPECFNGLPESKKNTAIQYVYLCQKHKLSEDEPIAAWNIFKVQNLTGKKFYANDEEVYSHFLNWIKNQKFTNGNISTVSKTGGNYRQSALEALHDRGKQKFDAARKDSTGA